MKVCFGNRIKEHPPPETEDKGEVDDDAEERVEVEEDDDDDSSLRRFIRLRTTTSKPNRKRTIQQHQPYQDRHSNPNIFTKHRWN